MVSLSEIEKLCREYSEGLDTLAERKREYDEEIENVLKRHLRGIKAAGEAVGNRKAKLGAAVEESPELFQKPKTIIMHGVQCGFRKVKGGLDWEDDEQVVKLIKKHLLDQFDLLVKVKETPIKTALAQLEIADLKRIGVSVVETEGDEVVVKAAVSEIEKWLKAFRKERERELKETA